MTLPLVVGADGSEASLEAVDWAAAEAVRHGAPLHVLHAAAGDREASGVLRAAVERAGAAAPAVRLSGEVVHADAISALVAGDRAALALVLGSRGLGGELPGLLLGSVALAVAARSHCPVVVVRGEARHRETRFGSVVVGVEAGEGSDTAVEFAFREARARRCRLVAVHAWNPRFGGAAPGIPPWYVAEAHRRPPAQVLDDALGAPAERYRDVPVHRSVIDGPARQALVAAASEADLLVVGARRRQAVAGLQLGLINHALLHHAPCPVTVVPRA